MESKNWKAKQEWLERVMASSLPHAEKTFAYVIYRCAFGDKIESYPDTDDFKEQGGFTSHGHFTEYREHLISSGVVTAVLDYHTAKAKSKNYVYTLNLDWDGTMAPKETRKKSPSEASMAPLGRAMAPSGQNHGTSGTSHGTTGASNTPSNTPTINTTSKITTPAAPVGLQEEESQSSLSNEVENPLNYQEPLNQLEPPLSPFERDQLRVMKREGKSDDEMYEWVMDDRINGW